MMAKEDILLRHPFERVPLLGFSFSVIHVLYLVMGKRMV